MTAALITINLRTGNLLQGFTKEHKHLHNALLPAGTTLEGDRTCLS